MKLMPNKKIEIITIRKEKMKYIINNVLNSLVIILHINYILHIHLNYIHYKSIEKLQNYLIFTIMVISMY